MGRIKAREGLMQLLFQVESTNEFTPETMEVFFENYEYSKGETKYIDDSINAIYEHQEVIDKYIIDNLEGWTINRIAKIDLSVLRIAIYEILYREDIPSEVAINEAIEIVKKYSKDESSKFVNGVLGSVMRSLE